MKTTIVLLFILATSAQSLACTSSFECGYGGKCVQLQGQYGGVCVTNQPQQHQYDNSIFHKDNMIDPADEIRKAQIQNLEIQRRQLELQKQQMEIADMQSRRQSTQPLTQSSPRDDSSCMNSCFQYEKHHSFKAGVTVEDCLRDCQ